jgi:hypothetical protein
MPMKMFQIYLTMICGTWIHRYWLKENLENENFDCPAKVVMYFRFELFFLPRNKEVRKKISVFLGQSQAGSRADMGRKSKRCLDIVGANAKMEEYKGLASVHGYNKEMLDDIFGFLRNKLRRKPRAKISEAKPDGS